MSAIETSTDVTEESGPDAVAKVLGWRIEQLLAARLRQRRRVRARTRPQRRLARGDRARRPRLPAGDGGSHPRLTS